MILQIYEIQTPKEALRLIEMGVGHIGSVALPTLNEKDSQLFETIRLTQQKGAKSSLIPLFVEPDRIMHLLEDYAPDIVHFCDDITVLKDFDEIHRFQREIKRYFPEIWIQRAIPIGRPGQADLKRTLDMAAQLEETTGFFLTDTLLPTSETAFDAQVGFVGITGQTCDWDVAAELVQKSKIPVILAGGLTPENVAIAIRKTKPAGVDSCSATNLMDEKGNPIRFQKDMIKVAAFIQNAQAEQTADLAV